MRTKINKVQSDAYKIIVKKIALQSYNSIIIIDAVRHELPLNIFCPIGDMTILFLDKIRLDLWGQAMGINHK